MSKIKNRVSVIIILVILVFACEKSEDQNKVKPEVYGKDGIKGLVQKGPFINGTSLTLYELNASLGQTGKSFSTQIIDNQGMFEFEDINLSEPLVEIRANGFYFNEITGEKSIAQLTLHALSDITDSTQVNVNILSELEKGRVDYLVKIGESFSNAKEQAQQEILSIFNIEMDSILSSEYLDISLPGDDNAILLAISAIIQGFRTDAEVAELLANIDSDIREDGVLNSTTFQAELVSHAKYFNLHEIRQNLEQRYESLGVIFSIPNFESIIQNFLSSTEFEFQGIVEYPENGSGGPNLLNPNIYKYNSTDNLGNWNNSITAINPKNIDLRVEITFNQDCEPGDTMDVCTGIWGLWVDGSGWEISYISDYSPDTQTFTFVNDDSGNHDMKLCLVEHGSGDIELYENDSIVLKKQYSW